MEHVTSDLHLGHSNIIKYCHRLQFMNDAERAVMSSGDNDAISRLKISWETTSRHDKAVIDNINSVVGENDTLRILGDFCWVRGHPDKIAAVYTKYREQIKCRNVHMVWGNHDPKVFSTGRTAVARLFTTTADLVTLVINGKIYVLSHGAYAIWDRRHHGARNLYGHSHSRAEKWLDSIMPGRFSLDCGIDNAYILLGEYRPFSIPEIEAIMSTRPGFGLLGQRHYHHEEE